MPVFFSPDGNPEVWDEKPDGYFTPEEWAPAHPDPVPDPPTTEELYNAERAVVFSKYERPYDGVNGGILNLTRMMFAAAQMEVPQDADKIAGIANRYQTELSAMAAEYSAIDEKYGVA